MVSVEVFVIFAVTALDFAVVPWRERLNEYVLNTKPLKRFVNSGPLSVWTHSMAVEAASIILIFDFCYKKGLISEEIKPFQSIWWR